MKIDDAVACLRQGGLVAFPTETVYGLGVDARNAQALERLYVVKGRPGHHPVIVHLAAAEALSDWAIDIPQAAWQLADAFWPGPLTLILRKAPTVLPQVTGGQETLGIRIPAHPVAQALLTAFGGGLAAPSANRFGQLSPTTAGHVLSGLGGDIDGVLEGGPCDVGVESTIIDLSGEQPVLLRPGMIPLAQIESTLGQSVALAGSLQRAPGTLKHHYAPRTPLLMLPTDSLQDLAHLYAATQSRVVFYSRVSVSGVHWHPMPQDQDATARSLYATLHSLDQQGFDKIVVEQPPADWVAVMDRLSRASAVGIGEHTP
jgi:L-threonylcarbamoyladenylate synthase